MPNQLRELIFRDEVLYIMEAHNALSAKIAIESGFEALWASGLTISATMGLRDRNEASWTQVLDIVEMITDFVHEPVLFDGDTGFGDANNVSRLVKKLCQRNVQGVCIEDKLFPKQNSFLGTAQPLIPVEDFCEKIKRGKDAQLNDDFVLVARVEALIAGHGMNEAFDRASRYQESGADAILIHSKKSDGEEILEFLDRWQNRCPVIIVPTKYYATPTDLFIERDVAAIIWANHSLRASISAMRSATDQIYRGRSLTGIETRIASLDQLFQLTNELST